MRVRTGLVAVCFLGLLVAGGGQAISAEEDAAAPLPAVVVTPAVSKSVSSFVEFLGQTEAFHSVDLRARVTGFLDERSFVEGSHVAKDDVLFVIDPAQFHAARDSAAANVQRVEATIEEAEAQLTRYETLAERGTASEASLDEAKATAGRARADLAAAKADLERAQLDVDYTQIATPIEGRVNRASVDTGNLVGPDSGVLATVVALDPVYVTFSITERDYLDFKEAIEAGTSEDFTPRITLANGQTYGPEGEVDFIDVRVDTSTGTIPIRATFPNPEGLLLPGQFVNVSLISSEPTNEIVVPQASIQQDQAGYFVLIVDADNKVERRTIELGQRLQTETVVTSGLVTGENIIVEGIQKVRPGATVTAVPLTQAEASQ